MRSTKLGASWTYFSARYGSCLTSEWLTGETKRYIQANDLEGDLEDRPSTFCLYLSPF